jgi:hypothetical protein
MSGDLARFNKLCEEKLDEINEELDSLLFLKYPISSCGLGFDEINKNYYIDVLINGDVETVPKFFELKCLGGEKLYTKVEKGIIVLW